MKLLDLFCGAGGAAVGYYRAGFDVVGVDLVHQPFYPFEFIQADSLSLDYEFLMSFDAIHASPPCQQYSSASALARLRGKVYPDLVHPVRRMLIASGKPYVIENVPGAPVRGIGLCGCMFDLGVRRRRLFESNIDLTYPVPCKCSKQGREIVTVAGAMYAKAAGAAAMGITWMIDKDQLTEAIPPVYTECIGLQLIRAIDDKLPVTVSETQAPGNSETNLHRRSETQLPRSSESESVRRFIPVTRRCKQCNKPLDKGSSRREYCDGLCRLRYFRSQGVAQ